MERETERKKDLAPFDVLLELAKESPVMPSPMEEALDELALITAVIMDPPQLFIKTDDSFSLRLFEYLASKVGSIISSFDHNKNFESLARKVRYEISRALWTKFDMSKLRRVSESLPKPSRIYYSRTGQLSFVEHLVENLQELVIKGKADSIGPLKYHILQLQKKLQFVSSRLMAVPEVRKQEAYVKELTKSIANMAYEVEYAIDLLLVKDIPIWCCVCWLRDILQELDHNERQVKMNSGDVQSMISSIIDNGEVYLDIIPVYCDTDISENLRMVFNDPVISRKFQIRMWTLVSSYRERKKEVFLELLGNALHHRFRWDFEKSLIEEAYISGMSEDKLEASVSMLLSEYKYFIILEDVQDFDALKDILRVFPQNIKKCRVLFTTSSADLAAVSRYGFRDDLFNKMSEDRTSTSQINKLTIDDDVVGFKEETETMFERLTDGPKQLRIISIVGMPGQGKTTFAKKIFHDHSIVNYFHVRARCYVYQVYEKRKLLLEILGQVVQLSDTIHQKNDLEFS